MLARLHALSLDSVAALLSAQWAVCAWGGVRCPASTYVLLASGIWLSYTADRFSDLWANPGLAGRTLRHALHARHRGSLAALWIVVFLVSWVAGVRILPWAALILGTALAVAAALYAAWPLARSGEADSGHPTKSVVAAILLTGAAGWGPLTLGQGELRVTPAIAVLCAFGVVAFGNLVLLRRARSRELSELDCYALPRPDTLALRADFLVVAAFVLVALMAP